MNASRTQRWKMLAREGDRGAAARLLIEARRRGSKDGILLGLLGSCEPSEEAWAELCSLLDTWSASAPELDALITWACERLESWPETLCVAPLPWIWSAGGGYRHPRLRLASTVDLRALPNRHGDPEAAHARTAAALRTLTLSPDVGRLRRLILPDRGLDEELLAETLTQRDWPHLDHLDLRGNGIDSLGATLLASSQRFPALRELLLERNDIDSTGVKALADAPSLNHITLLGLSFNPIGDAGLSALSQSPHLHLDALQLGCCDLTDGGLEGLAERPATRELAQLVLNYNLIGDNALHHLSGLSHLTRLELSYNKLSTESIPDLHRCAFRPNLQRLALSGNHLGDDGVSELARSGPMSNLRSLLLNQCELRGLSLRTLADSEALGDARLETLELNGNTLHNAGDLLALLSSSSCQDLRRLELRRNELKFSDTTHIPTTALTHLQIGYNPIGDAGLHALAGAATIARIEVLGLEHTGATDDGLIALLDALHAAPEPRLRSLSLRGNSIGDDGLRALSRSPLLAQLELLDLFANSFGDRARTQLADAFRQAQQTRRRGRLYC